MVSCVWDMTETRRLFTVKSNGNLFDFFPPAHLRTSHHQTGYQFVFVMTEIRSAITINQIMNKF